MSATIQTTIAQIPTKDPRKPAMIEARMKAAYAPKKLEGTFSESAHEGEVPKLVHTRRYSKRTHLYILRGGAALGEGTVLDQICLGDPRALLLGR